MKLASYLSRIALLSTLVTSHQAASNENYELALRAFAQNDVDASYVYLKNALADEAVHLPSKVLMGEVLLLRGYTHEAIEELEESIALGADSNLVARNLIHAYVIIRDANSLYDFEANNLNLENTTELMLARANAYISQDLLKKAENTYLALLSKGNQSLRVHSSLIDFYIRTKQLDKAEEQLKRMKPSFGNSSLYYYLNGRILSSRTNINKAILSLERAFELDKFDPLIQRALASELMKAQSFERANDLVDSILTQTPDDPYALLYKGRLLSIGDENELAVKAFEQLNSTLSIIPDEYFDSNTSLQLIAGITHYLTGNFQSALSSLESYVAKVPTNANALGVLVDIYIKSGTPRKALESLDRQYDFVSGDLALGSLLCELYIDTSKIFRCEQLLSLLSFKYPQHPNLPVIEAKLLQAKGKFAQALALFEKSIIGKPQAESTSLQLMYITLLRQTGNAEGALAYINALLQAQPLNTGFSAIKAQLLMDKQQYRDVQAINEVLLKNNPGSYSAQLNKAKLLIQNEAFSEAEATLVALAERYSKEFEVKFELARLFTLLEQLDKSETILLDVIALNPDQVDAQELMVEVYARSRQYEKALSIANKLNRDHFLNPRYIRLKADILVLMEDFENAHKQYKTLFGIWNDSAQLLVGLAELQRQANDLDGALISLKRSYELESSHFIKRQILKVALITKNKELSASTLEELIADFPKDSEILSLQARYIETLENNPMLAEQLYYQAIMNNNKNTFALTRLYSLVMNRPDRQSQLFENAILEAISTSTQSNLQLNLLADYYLVNDRPEEAKTLYLQLITNQAPNLPDVYNNLANIYFDSEKFDQAKTSIQLAYELAPSQSHILNTFGRILLVNKENEQALSMLREAYAKNSQSANIQVNLATALNNLTRQSEAKQIFDKIDLSKLDRAGIAQHARLKSTL